MTTNVIISFPNQTDNGTLSNGSWGGTLNNLKDIRYSLKARSTNANASSTKFDIDFGTVKPLQLFALIANNISEQGTWRVTVGNDATFATYAYQSAYMSALPALDSFVYEWEEDSFWSGVLSADRLATYPRHAFIVSPTALSCRYIRVEILDTGNTSGYVEIGRFFASKVWTPTYNPGYGFNIQHETATSVVESAGSVEYFDNRPLARVAKFSLDWLTPTEAYGVAFDMERQLGLSGEAFFVPFYDEPDKWLQTSFPCRLKSLSATELPVYGIWKKPYELRERIG